MPSHSKKTATAQTNGQPLSTGRFGLHINFTSSAAWFNREGRREGMMSVMAGATVPCNRSLVDILAAHEFLI